jgi:hypothetical protein
MRTCRMISSSYATTFSLCAVSRDSRVLFSAARWSLQTNALHAQHSHSAQNPDH